MCLLYCVLITVHWLTTEQHNEHTDTLHSITENNATILSGCTMWHNRRNTRKTIERSSPRVLKHCFARVTRCWSKLQPFNRWCRIYSGFHFLLAHQVPLFKYVKGKMWDQPARFEKSRPPFCQIWIIFTHLKLWIASARHNSKWVKI